MNGCKKCDEHTYVEEFDYEYDGDDENERWGIVPCSNCNSSNPIYFDDLPEDEQRRLESISLNDANNHII